METPHHGERPFKIEKPTIEQVKSSKGFSVLNEMRLKEHVIWVDNVIGK